MLRSSEWWSLGITREEKSIYRAYKRLIRSSRRYVYIENQYFISSPHGQGLVRNKILDALYQRIKRAILGREAFRVIVVLPVYAAGALELPYTRFIIKNHYDTINRLVRFFF